MTKYWEIFLTDDVMLSGMIYIVMNELLCKIKYFFDQKSNKCKCEMNEWCLVIVSQDQNDMIVQYAL